MAGRTYKMTSSRQVNGGIDSDESFEIEIGYSSVSDGCWITCDEGGIGFHLYDVGKMAAILIEIATIRNIDIEQ